MAREEAVVILVAALVLLVVILALVLLGWRRPFAELVIFLDQPEVQRGEPVTGIVRLQALRSMRAGHLSLALVAEAQVTEFDHGTRQQERVERYREDLILSDPETYPEGFEGQYRFELLLPRIEALTAEAEVAALQPHQCERLHWYLIARLPVAGKEQMLRLPLSLQSPQQA